MKKIICLILTISMLIIIAGCGDIGFEDYSSSDDYYNLVISNYTSNETYSNISSTANSEVGGEDASSNVVSNKETSSKPIISNFSTEATSSEITTSSNHSNTIYVWIAASGKKYHSNPNCSSMKNPSKVTKEQAESKGRTPCSKCY